MQPSVLSPAGRDRDRDYRGVGAFQCPQCSKVYRRKGSLSQHVRLECGKDPQFACPACHYRSKQRSGVNRHVRMMHPELMQ